MLKGTVKWYDAKKGFGFITREDGQEVFVHGSGIEKGRTHVFLNEGDEVEFEQENILINGKSKAIQVVITKEAPRKESKLKQKREEK